MITTTKEQSERLLNAGLDKMTASMHWGGIGCNVLYPQRCTDRQGEPPAVPAWTADDLIAVLPKTIRTVNGYLTLQVNYMGDYDQWSVWYDTQDGSRSWPHTANAPIFALVGLVLDMLSFKYIKR